MTTVPKGRTAAAPVIRYYVFGSVVLCFSLLLCFLAKCCIMIASREKTMTDPVIQFYVSGAVLACFFLLLFSVLLLLLRIRKVYREIRQNRRRLSCPNRNSSSSKPLRTMIVLGSGGHTTEMLYMTKHLNPAYYYPIHYCKATTDTTSRDRVDTMIQQGSKTNNNQNAARNHPHVDATKKLHLHDIPRSREVGQSYFSSIFTTIYAFLWAFVLVGRWRPHLLICNGPGTCVPLCAAVGLYRILGLSDGRIVFIESYCRVQTLSLTGKLLYHVADVFVVHWKELHAKYPDSVLTSSFLQQ